MRTACFGNHFAFRLLVCLVFALLANGLARPAPAQIDLTPKLTVIVLRGDGEFINIQKCCESRRLLVEVRDEDGRPVSNAQVTVILPSRGPSGIFPGNARSVFVTTDGGGRATATGLRHNGVLGQFVIRVLASSAGRNGRTVITQNNANVARRDVAFIQQQAGSPMSSQFIVSEKELERSKGSKWKKWIIIGGIAGGAAIGYFKYKPFGGSGNKVGISIGNPTIGGPTIGGPR